LSSEFLTVTAPAKESSDLIVAAEKRDEKLAASVLKNESEIPIASAFEQFASQLSNTEAAVHMRLTKTIGQVA
jgi:hypothetical protein